MGLREIAEHARGTLVGFPWNQVNPNLSDAIHDPKRRQIMSALFVEVAKMTQQLEMLWDIHDPTPAQKLAMVSAWDFTSGTIEANEGVFISAVKANAETVAGVSFDREVLRAFVHKSYVKFQEGYNLDQWSVPQWLMTEGQLTEEQVVNHLDRTYAAGNALLFLYRCGALNPLKKRPTLTPWMAKLAPTVGVAPGVIVGVVIASVMMFAILAWFCLEWKRMETLTALAKSNCERAVNETDPVKKATAMKLCTEAMGAIERSQMKPPVIGDIGSGLGWGIAILAAFWGISQLQRKA